LLSHLKELIRRGKTSNRRTRSYLCTSSGKAQTAKTNRGAKKETTASLKEERSHNIAKKATFTIKAFLVVHPTVTVDTSSPDDELQYVEL